MGALQAEDCSCLKWGGTPPARVGIYKPGMAGGETQAQWIYPGGGGGRGQTGSVRELRPDSAFALTASPEDEEAMLASVGEIGGGECDRVTGPGDRAGVHAQ